MDPSAMSPERLAEIRTHCIENSMAMELCDGLLAAQAEAEDALHVYSKAAVERDTATRLWGEARDKAEALYLRQESLEAERDVAQTEVRDNARRQEFAHDAVVSELQAENQRLTAENERLERMLAGTNVRWSEKLHEAEREERDRLARQVTAATDGLRDLLEGALDMRSYVPDHFAEKWDHDSYIERATAVLAAFITTEETTQ